MSYTHSFDQVKAQIDAYNSEILKFLSGGGGSNVRASSFLQTYMGIQAVSDEYGRPDAMYEVYKDTLNEYIAGIASPESRAINSTYGSCQDYIIEYDKQWRHFSSYSFVLNKLFTYIDRYYLS